MKLAALCVFLALAAGMAGLGLGIYGLEQASQNSRDLRVLLLDGKTASAVSAKKTKQEVTLLFAQQAFDQHQSQVGQKIIRAAIRSVEQHVDRTICLAIAREAQRGLSSRAAAHH